jgi:hypothetical protein
MTSTPAPLGPADHQEFPVIVALFTELGKAIQSHTKGTVPPVEAITLRIPPAEPAIHAFYTAVSWLYVCVIEAGAAHFPFLAERASALSIDTAEAMPKFREDINTFRTVLQHNLKIEDATDAAKLSHCERWMATALGRQVDPGKPFWPDEGDWTTLVRVLRGQARRFLEMHLATITAMGKDPFAADVVALWVLRCSRCLPAYKFDLLAQEAATDLGLPYLDVVKLRKVNVDKWNQRLRLLREGADLLTEARRLVEATLLNEADNYLPVGGKDVIAELGLKPGSEVAKALQKARELYRQAPCSRADLLKKLKASLSTAP